MKLRYKTLPAALALALGAASVAPAAGAATFNVSTAAQLEAAVFTATRNAQDDTINLAPGVYSLLRGLDVGAGFEVNPPPGETLTFRGPAAGQAVIDGSGPLVGNPIIYAYRPAIFHDLTIRGNGDRTGIQANEPVELERTTLTNHGLALFTSDVATVTNSTISGNQNGFDIEGILVLLNSTVVGNTEFGVNGFNITADNTIIADNGLDCLRADVIGAGSGNLDSDGTCWGSGASGITADPMLGPLQDNGGPTPTHALLPGSPAVNAGTSPGCPSTDQRGVTRPKSLVCDIGAVEMTPFEFESASGVGSVTTDPEGNGATSSDPVETSVTHPGAAISIREGPDAAAEFGFLGQRITIDVTPDGTPAAPIVISFAIDATAIPAAQSAATIVVRKDGVVVGPCTGAGATPDPCVASRTTAGNDAFITVRTSTASDWDLAPGVDDVTPPAIACTVPDESVWYGADVGVPCTAGDGESGLASASDAAFSLATAVAPGTETAGAATDARDVCDNAGNCATAGRYSFKVDRRAPSLSLPANLTLDATSPAGAVVTYAATASDGGSGVAAVSCCPSSGSTLAIGQTTVTCTATDHAGNAASGSFTVTVAGAKEQLAALIQDVVNASRLSPAAKTLLIGKLNQLLASFDPGNAVQRQSVCLALQVFKTAVHLQAGKTITQAQAAEWIADANRIRGVLGC